jgi:nicotinate-nucleotide adenylyltransferase
MTLEAGSHHRIGIMGGSFDPIHIAHLLAAENAREALQLDRVLFVPVGDQPLKPGAGVAPVSDRVEMVRLAIASNPHFALSTLEVDRSGPSYTVDTLRLLSEEWGGPGRADLWFIVGADSLLSFSRWRDPQGILAQVRLAAVRRPDYLVDLNQLRAQVPGIMERVDWVDAPLMDVSSSDIRTRLKEGRSICYLLPDAVREYIEELGLYKV